jgi:dihydrofolate reductase
MNKVFIDVGVSLDGYVAGPNGGATNPLGDGGTAIHDWMFNQKGFREHLGLEGGEVGNQDNDIIENIFSRIGANIMGKNMFAEGEANWPEEAPFHTPVYVLTHQLREPWERKGGTTFYFVNDDIRSVLSRAKKDAGNKDVRISGGASVIQQYLNASLIDELNIHLAPLMLGKGVHLFDKLETENFSLDINDTIHSASVTHLFYKVVNHR